MGYCDERLRRLEPLWSRMLRHPFLLETRDGTLEEGVFANWLRQDYLFVRAALPFLGVLLSKAPPGDRTGHAAAIRAMEEELELFRERAVALGVDLDGVSPSLVNHAYVQFLMATARGRSYPEGYTVLYAAEKAYHESWRVVDEGLDPDSPWRPFVANWAGEDFAGYVASLEEGLNDLVADVGPGRRASMDRLFELTVRYEIAFWEMAYTGSGWPGIPVGPEGGPADGPAATTAGAGKEA
jgi:thiaminase/transcriptional activator TenA